MKRWALLALLLSSAMARAATPVSLAGQVDPYDPQSWSFHLSVDPAAPVKLTCDADAAPYERHLLKGSPAPVLDLTVRGLKAATAYTCVATALDGSQHQSTPLHITTAPLPRDLEVPVITTAAANPASTGYTLYGSGLLKTDWHEKNTYLEILDAQGNVRWYYAGVGAGDVDETWLGDGRILFGGSDNGHFAPTIVNLDKQLEFVGTSATSTPYELAGQYNHDAGLSAKGTSIFTLAYAKVPGAAGVDWVSFVIKEIDLATNQVIWYWDPLEHGMDPRHYPTTNFNKLAPFHANAIWDRWEDGRLVLYLSLRNANQLLKIDYLSGDILWTMGVNGDFTLLEPDGSLATPDRWFFCQHDVKLIGDALYVYDNGTDRYRYGGKAYSRALILELDQQALTARIRFEYTEPHWDEPSLGGFDPLPNGDTLVALAHTWAPQVPHSSPHKSALIELSPQGGTVWRAEFTSELYAIYRADHIDGCGIFANTTYCPQLEQ